MHYPVCGPSMEEMGLIFSLSQTTCNEDEEDALHTSQTHPPRTLLIEKIALH